MAKPKKEPPKTIAELEEAIEKLKQELEESSGQRHKTLEDRLAALEAKLDKAAKDAQDETDKKFKKPKRRDDDEENPEEDDEVEDDEDKHEDEDEDDNDDGW